MQYMDGYNQSRPHSSLDKHTPDEAYAVMLPTGKLAAYASAETPLKKLGRLFKGMGPLLCALVPLLIENALVVAAIAPLRHNFSVA
jgi:hypothetical protein